jgi:hypothetical protein
VSPADFAAKHNPLSDVQKTSIHNPAPTPSPSFTPSSSYREKYSLPTESEANHFPVLLILNVFTKDDISSDADTFLNELEVNSFVNVHAKLDIICFRLI